MFPSSFRSWRFLLLLLLLVAGCQTEAPPPPPAPAPAAPAVESDSSSKKVAPPLPSVSTTLDMKAWMALVDTVFPPDKNYPELTELEIEKQPKRFVMALNRDGLFQVQRYQSFWWLHYDTPQKAKKAFQELLDLAAQLTERQDSKSAERGNYKKFYNTVYKGGALFVLHHNRILHRGLWCKDDYHTYEQQEAAMMAFLFGDSPPESDYYYRYCCSCPPGQNMQFK